MSRLTLTGAGGGEPPGITDDLVAYYKFSENGVDSTGNWDLTNVNSATFSNSGEAVSGKTGYYTDVVKAVDNSYWKNDDGFDGLHNADEATWMFFVNLQAVDLYAGLVTQWENMGSGSNWRVMTGDTGEQVALYTGRSSSYAFCQTVDDVIAVGTGWHHVRVALDVNAGSVPEDQCTIYVDGVEITSVTDSTSDMQTLRTNTNWLSVGSSEYAYGTQSLTAEIDEVGIWSRLVSDEEAEAFENGTGLPY